MWVVMGCEFDPARRMCTGTNSFNGHVSQFNMYRRELTFADTPTKAGEISYNYAFPRHVFEDNAQLTNVLLVWNEWEFESGVTRTIPSEAQKAACDVINRTPPCRLYAGEFP